MHVTKMNCQGYAIRKYARKRKKRARDPNIMGDFRFLVISLYFPHPIAAMINIIFGSVANRDNSIRLAPNRTR